MDLEGCASVLEGSGDYKVLRRVPRPKRGKRDMPADLRFAMIVDTETTGLDLRTDEVIEIGFVLVAYQNDGIKFIENYGNELREPNREIPKEVQDLTGITPETVKGKSISREKLLEPLSLASIIIAHNAAFDRPMCERLMPEFKEKPWACSLTEVPWRVHGFESLKLKYLLMENGYFHEGHRALDDCVALATLLSCRLSGDVSYFEELLDSARLPNFIFKVQAPYDLRAEMRAMGYRWMGNEDRPGGLWFKTVSSESFAKEESQIRQLQTKGAQLEFFEQDAFTRYRLKFYG